MNNKVIYTSITNGYDHLPEYKAIDPTFDYICFTNDYPAGSKIGCWLIKPIPYKHVNPVYKSRYAKILPHEVLSEYEWSVWLDANLIIKSYSIYRAINKCIESDQLWSGIPHPKFDCIYQDIKECLIGGKISYSEGMRQRAMLEQNNYPRHNGLFENNFIIRKHNNQIIKNISNSWWHSFLELAPRDQFSLFFIFWKNQYIPQRILNENLTTRNISGIEYLSHNTYNIFQRIKYKWRCIYNRIKMRYNISGTTWDSI